MPTTLHVQFYALPPVHNERPSLKEHIGLRLSARLSTLASSIKRNTKTDDAVLSCVVCWMQRLEDKTIGNLLVREATARRERAWSILARNPKSLVTISRSAVVHEARSQR